MGIFNFFKFFKDTFGGKIYKVKNSVKNEVYIDVDNLMIDMNGIFHTSAQKIFKYGSYKPVYETIVHNNSKNQEQVFKDVCETVENILLTVNPNKRLIMCVDGPAPLAKQIQQSKRRYVSSVTKKDDDDTVFDSNCISPGTKFMDHMTKYIDWYIRNKLSEDPLWQNLDVVFSSDKVEAEGEHKIQSYVRKYGKSNESFMIHGLDSDLIMLSLISHCEKFYVLRDDTFDKNNNYLLLDMALIRPEIIDMMKWEEPLDYENRPIHKFNEKWAINDFVFLCFMVGNDFLHHVPALEIVEGGIGVIIECCKKVSMENGHITRSSNGKVIFSPKCLSMFFEMISEYEKELLERKMVHRRKYFDDETLINSVKLNDKTKNYDVDIDKYRMLYCEHNFGKKEDEMIEICHEYLTGLQWVLQYYTAGVPDWNWYFPYHYTPPAKIIALSLQTYEPKVFRRNKPMLPFQQLFYILPTKSCKLLPEPLDEELKLMKSDTTDVEIDLSGKKYEYQGVVLLPFLDLKVVNKIYKKHYEKVSETEKKRNYLGQTLLYRYNSGSSKLFKSYYGNFESKVSLTKLEI